MNLSTLWLMPARLYQKDYPRWSPHDLAFGFKGIDSQRFGDRASPRAVHESLYSVVNRCLSVRPLSRVGAATGPSSARGRRRDQRGTARPDSRWGGSRSGTLRTAASRSNVETVEGSLRSGSGHHFHCRRGSGEDAVGDGTVRAGRRSENADGADEGRSRS